MNLCPIAKWKKHRPDAPALASLTYRELDALVQKLCYRLSTTTQTLLSFTPENTPIHIALFFAAWRLGKAVYPLNPRLPEQAILAKIQKTESTWIEPSRLLLSKKLDISEVNISSLATLIETSSASKIACHTLKSHIISAQNAISALNITPDSTICLNLPLFHVSGIASMIRAFTAGAQIVFSEELENATHISMVPTQLYRLLKENKSLPHCKCLLLGGAPLSEKLYRSATEKKFPVLRSYGMTETASMIICEDTVLPNVEIKFTPSKEILLRCPTLFSHYFGKAEREDWFATRDLGKINSKGQIEILGRKDRQFISGGENILPEEIEKALLTLDSVIGARITPKPDLELGMKCHAKIYTEHPIHEETLKAKLKELLAPHKIPKRMEIITGEAPSKFSLEPA